MTDNEKTMMLETEEALRVTAEKHKEKADAATDEIIRRVELHQYDLHVFAAVTVRKLITQLEKSSQS